VECPYCSGATLDAPSPLRGIAGYQLLRFLGAGGMGSVYLADDVTLGRRVAIKVISEKLGAESEARARFMREARAMASVEHPHIVRVYAFGEAEGSRAYLVMEYVEGETLAERIQRTGRLPVEEALSILRQVVEALEAAWEQRIVHRDIKPSNILLDKRRRVRVGDFGLAKPLHMAGDATLSQQGYILGTPHYISPEQARGQPVDFRSDVYSLGIVLYEMLAGERPFAGATPFDVVAKHLHEPLPALEPKRPDVPPEVRRLLEAMTQKDAEKRPASYGEILARLDAMPGMAARTPSATPISARTPTSLRWRKIAAITAAIVLLLGAGWLAWKALRPVETPSGVEEKRLVVAVTPFYGPDEDSAKEGRVMAALVEKEITNRLGKENARVLGIEDTKQPVHDHDAARALGERLGASVVIWGEAFVLRGETEIQPYFTMVRPKTPSTEAPAQTGMQMMAAGQDPLAALQERAAKSVVVEAAAPNQIELRKTSAAGVGDVVLFLAGIHALYTEKNPEKALALFTQAPKTAESLRYRAQALLQLNKKDQASAALHDAVALDPHDAQSYAQLGDLHMEAGEFKEAVAAYRGAAQAGGTYTTRHAVFFEGKLYKTDEFKSKRYYAKLRHESPYLLGQDPTTGKVLERYRLPGVARSFTVKGEGVQISYAAYNPPETTITFSHGKFDRPVFYGPNLLYRRMGMVGAWTVAANFLDNMEGSEHTFDAKFAPSATEVYEDAPRSLSELEGALHQAITKDPTQPWYPFLLGEALWSEGRKDDATKTWQQMFSGNFPGTPYYEFCWMAMYFERLGQREWADRAYEEALARRKELPQPIGFATLIERLFNTPFIGQAAAASQKGTDPERAYLWLLRVREISGVCPEGDDFVAAAWAKYYRERGEVEKARREAAFFEKARAHPLNITRILTQLDYALYACLTLVLGCLMLAVMLLAKAVRQRVPASGPGSDKGLAFVPAVVSAIPRRERATLALGFLAALVSGVFVVPPAYLFLRAGTTDIVSMDSLGSDRFLQESEERFKDRSPALFLLAVVNHMAGNTERARQLYELLPNDPRAQKNLAALQQGELVPPEPLSAQDLYRALAAKNWNDWLEMLLNPAYVVTHLRDFEAPTWPAGISFLFVGVALLNVLLLSTFLVVPYRGGAELSPPRDGVRRRLARAAFLLVPGTYDLRRGPAWRGYVTFTLSTFVVLVGLAQLYLGVTKQGPAPGFVSGSLSPNLARSSPLPTPPSLPNLEAVKAYHYWTFFWAFPHAKVFWTIVALAAVISLVLHITRFRRIWSLYPRESSPGS